MSLLSIKNAITSRAGRQLLSVQKKAPTILFVVGVVGVVATAVLAARATLKLDEVLQETEKDLDLAKTLDDANYTEDDRKKDIALIYGKSALKIAGLYAPAVGVGVLSIAALTGSHVILTKRNAAVMAAYAALEKGFKAYRKRVVDEYGEEKDREFRHGWTEREIVEESETGPVIKTIKSPSNPNEVSIYARFFDKLSPNWEPVAEYNMFFLQAQQTYANNKFHAQGYLFLNDVYEALGLPKSKAGCVVGWILTKDGDNFVDFGIFTRNSQKIREFVNGEEGSVLLDFNVDGLIWDKI